MSSRRTAEVARVREGVSNSSLEPDRDYPVVGRDQSNGGHTKYVVLDTGKGRGHYIWAPEHHVHVSKQGWESMPERIAIHRGFTDPNKGDNEAGGTPIIVRLGHVSGNSIDVLHCPFCGSGAVIARSDGTIECNFCTSVFTVQVQPQYAAFPQTSDGMPYPWPGQPDPGSVVSPGGAAMPGDPMGAGGIGGAPADLAPDAGDDAPPWAQDGSDEAGPGDDTDQTDDSSGDDSAPPFAKGKKGDSKKDKASVGGKDKPPFGKKSSYLNARGARLDEEDFMRHLAILHARDPRAMAETIKENRS